MKESLYPKKGYRVLSMIHPRQYMKHPTNNGRYFGAWRYAEDRATQARAQLLVRREARRVEEDRGSPPQLGSHGSLNPRKTEKTPFRQSELFKFSSIYCQQ